jgi:hypothetical protein
MLLLPHLRHVCFFTASAETIADAGIGKRPCDECWRSVQPYVYADLQSQLMRTAIMIGKIGLHRPHGITVMVVPIPRQRPKLQNSIA